MMQTIFSMPPNGKLYEELGSSEPLSCQTVMMFERATALEFTTIAPILYIHCCGLYHNTYESR